MKTPDKHIDDRRALEALSGAMYVVVDSMNTTDKTKKGTGYKKLSTGFTRNMIKKSGLKLDKNLTFMVRINEFKTKTIAKILSI